MVGYHGRFYIGGGLARGGHDPKNVVAPKLYVKCKKNYFCIIGY